MTAVNASWTWHSASSASTTSTAPSSSSSSPHTLSSAHFSTTSSSSSSSNSDESPATTSASSSTASTSYKSKSDAFFSSYASMAPLQPPSSIFSRRASDSCLPPPCAAPVKFAAKVAIQSAQASISSARPSVSCSSSLVDSASGQQSRTRERFSSLPDIREHQSCAPIAQGLGIRSPSPPLLASTSASTSTSSSSLQSSRSASLNSSGSSSPSTHRNRQSSIEDIEARLQAAISSLREDPSNDNQEEEGDMYNDMPSSSSSSSTSAASSRTASTANTHRSFEQQHSVFEEEEDEDDENGGTTIRIRLASAGDLISRPGRNYEQDALEYEDSFEPCYPLTPLEVDNKPLHRIRRKISIRRAISDSCAPAATQGRFRNVDRKGKEQSKSPKERRKVSFCDCVQVVDVFAAIDYPARRGPPPIERLTMRDVLELRQIKLELAAYMGDELPEPEHVETVEEQEEENSKHLVEISENSLPTTPALEGCPILEQMGEITPLASSRRRDQGEEEEEEESASYRQNITPKSSSASSALGPGMQIDLHSLIEPPSNIQSSSLSHEEHDDVPSSSMTSSSMPSSTSSFTYSSLPSSCQESEINSLSCSPTTSDSEFGSGSGTLSSCEEYDSNTRRGSTGDNSCEFDDGDETTEDDDEMGDEDDNNDHQFPNDGNTRTPTRVSLLRPGRFESLPSPKSRKTLATMNNSSDRKKDESGQIEVGCIQIALPALVANDGYNMNNIFDLSPSRQQDAWNPTTF